MAVGGYTAFMTTNPTINCILIIRSQAEYSPASQMMCVRYILEIPATGQRRGFTDMEALLKALRIELVETHRQIIPAEQQEGKL